MHRFYCPQLSAQNNPGALSDASPVFARLDPQEAHHAKRVLRMELGEEIELFDGKGVVGKGVLANWSHGAEVRLTERRGVPHETPALDLAVAIPKGPRADDMINQLSQLGVDRLIALRTSRGVVDPRPQKIDRFTRAAVEAAKQCGRAYLMSVEPPMDLPRVLSEPHDLRLIAAPGAATPPRLAERIQSAQRMLVLIGPEGGWTDAEMNLAQKAGCEAWPLGTHVMRIETAAATAAAVARYLARNRG